MGIKFYSVMAATLFAAIADIHVLAADKKSKDAADKKPAIVADAEDQPEQDKKSNVSAKVDQYTRTLAFDTDNSFRVVQFSDIWVDGDAQNFLETQKFMERLLKKEQPDLIVITGDVVDPAHEAEYEGHWQSALETIIKSKTPYVHTGGSLLPTLSRADALAIDRSYGGDLSWSGFMWNEGNTRVEATEDLIGFYTSRIPVMDINGT